MVRCTRWALIVTLALMAAGCSSGGDGGDDGGEDAGATTTTAAVPEGPSVRMVTLNQLHGLEVSQEGCTPANDSCQAEDRLTLLFTEIEDVGCPEVVGLQEIGPIQIDLVPQRLPDLCDGQYELVYGEQNGLDEQMIFTSLPVLDQEDIQLSGVVWTAHWAQLDSDLGPIDFLTTHQASGAFNPDCTNDPGAPDECPALCEVGVEVGTCQTREILQFLDEHADPAGVTVVAGDLNAEIDDSRITPYTDADFIDSWTAAGNPECDPDTGEGCGCCLGNETGDIMDDISEEGPPPYTGRIDFLFAKAGPDCDLTFDTPDDANDNGTGTGIFAGEAAAEAVNGMRYPADHSGVQAEIFC